MGAAGLSWTLGPTGGYLMAFPLAAALVGWISGPEGGGPAHRDCARRRHLGHLRHGCGLALGRHRSRPRRPLRCRRAAVPGGCRREGGHLLRGDAPDRREASSALIRLPPRQDLSRGPLRNSGTALQPLGKSTRFSPARRGRCGNRRGRPPRRTEGKRRSAALRSRTGCSARAVATGILRFSISQLHSTVLSPFFVAVNRNERHIYIS